MLLARTLARLPATGRKERKKDTEGEKKRKKIHVVEQHDSESRGEGVNKEFNCAFYIPLSFLNTTLPTLALQGRNHFSVNSRRKTGAFILDNVGNVVCGLS